MLDKYLKEIMHLNGIKNGRIEECGVKISRTYSCEFGVNSPILHNENNQFAQ